MNQVDRLSVSAKTCRQLTLKLQQKVSNQQLAKLGKEEQRLRHSLKSLGFLSLIVQEEIKHITQSLQSQSTMAENLEVSIKFFDTIIEACTLTKKGLENSLNQM
jgi:Holliday junction resolvasome RuvABC DNA-binding subunit